MSIQLTLVKIRALAQHLSPYTRPTCHITGTNGKGSVSALLSSIFTASALTVGRFNSPHLVSVRDSITINGQPVDQSVYDNARSEVEKVDAKHATGASNFEILVLTALLIFEAARLDVVVIEVGMGGRCDATNIIADSAILVSALTSVDLDHIAFLGPTVRDIAREKAAIVRSGKVLVVGQQKRPEVLDMVKDVIKARSGELVRVSDGAVMKRKWDISVDGPEPAAFRLGHAPPAFHPVRISMSCFPGALDASFPLHGEHQLHNLAIAVSVISVVLTHHSCAWFALRERITPRTVAEGIKLTSWAGRLSWHSVALPSCPDTRTNILVDGAHNPASAAALSAYISALLREHNSPSAPISVTYILALSDSPQKQPRDTLMSLIVPEAKNAVALVGFSEVDGMPWVTSVDPDVLKRALPPVAEVWCPDERTAIPWKGVNEQLIAALEWALSKGDETLVVVAGSLYLVSDFYRLLKGWNA